MLRELRFDKYESVAPVACDLECDIGRCLACPAATSVLSEDHVWFQINVGVLVFQVDPIARAQIGYHVFAQERRKYAASKSIPKGEVHVCAKHPRATQVVDACVRFHAFLL